MYEESEDAYCYSDECESHAEFESQAEYEERTYKQKWVIPNWDILNNNYNQQEDHETEIVIKQQNIVYVKWLVGLKFSTKSACLYSKLIFKHHCIHHLREDLTVEREPNGGLRTWAAQDEKNMFDANVMDRIIGYIDRNSDGSFYKRSMSNKNGYLVFTFKYGPDVQMTTAIKHHYHTQENFLKTSKKQFLDNMQSLLSNSSSSDTEILTNDGHKLSANKVIMQAQCPIFATVHQYETNGKTTVNVDFSAKTMKIWLHYWYTGELLQSWEDDDVIVEFTRAAILYEMCSVREMLDGLLGCRHKDVYKKVDVQLLKISAELDLENAEARLLKQVVQGVSDVKHANDLFEMFSLKLDDSIYENLSVSEVLKLCNGVVNEQKTKKSVCSELALLSISSQLGLRNVELQLLENFAEKAKKANCADALFALVRNESMHNHDTANLLVRAKPK